MRKSETAGTGIIRNVVQDTKVSEISITVLVARLLVFRRIRFCVWLAGHRLRRALLGRTGAKLPASGKHTLVSVGERHLEMIRLTGSGYFME